MLDCFMDSEKKPKFLLSLDLIYKYYAKDEKSAFLQTVAKSSSSSSYTREKRKFSLVNLKKKT